MEKETFCPYANPYQAIEGQRGTLICLRESCQLWNKEHEGCSHRVGTEAELAQTDYLIQIASAAEGIERKS